MICPNCGAEIPENMKFCNQCGKKLGRKNVLVICCVLAIVCLAGVLYYTQSVKPIKESKEIFAQATYFENQEEYIKALEFYEKVNLGDTENYDAALDKITEINQILDANKMAAIGYIVLENAGYVDALDQLTDIQVNASSRKMTGRINNIGYMIDEKGDHSAEYHPAVKSNIEGYYITEYKAPHVNNGNFTADLNWILQDTSNTLFMTQELFTKPDLIKDKLVEQYVSEYYETKLLPVISE